MREFSVECTATGLVGMAKCHDVDDCVFSTCGDHGKCVDEVGPAPAFTCKCDEGFELKKSKNGEKYCADIQDCKKDSCGPGTCEDLVNDYKCHCPTGHHVGEKDGKKTCLPNECSSETPSLKNGKQKTKHEGPIDFSTGTLRYKCDEGYSTDGSQAQGKRAFSLQCKSDSTLVGWTECQKISCGTATVLPFTELVEPKDATQAVLYEEEAKYKCPEGYTIKGKKDGKTEFSVKCKKNGKLTDPKVCEPVKCGDAPKIKKATAGISGDMSYGMTLDYMCDAGYTRDGTVDGKSTFSVECGKDGEFSGVPKETPCKPISVPRPSIGNAKLTEYAGKDIEDESKVTTVEYPEGLEYHCADGYTEDGSPNGKTKLSAKVKKTGAIKPDLPTECVPVTYFVKGRVTNEKTNEKLVDAKVKLLQFGEDGLPTGKEMEGKTGGAGYFTFKNVEPGQYELQAENGDGFESEKAVIDVTGDVTAGGAADMKLTPKLRAGEWKARLKRDDEPDEPLKLRREGKGNKDKKGLCGKGQKCGMCEGDCDEDSDCAGKLKCFHRRNNGPWKVPGCSTGGPDDVHQPPRDYCYMPPEDLDLYAKWGSGKVFSGKKNFASNKLDGKFIKDASDGKGPEVIFLTGAGKCKSNGSGKASRCDIRVHVKHLEEKFSKNSGALVTLESQYGIQATLKVKDCQGSLSEDKKWWHVATLNGETDELKWQCDSGKKAPPNWPEPTTTTEAPPEDDESDFFDDNEDGGDDMPDFDDMDDFDGGLDLHGKKKHRHHRHHKKSKAKLAGVKAHHVKAAAASGSVVSKPSLHKTEHNDSKTPATKPSLFQNTLHDLHDASHTATQTSKPAAQQQTWFAWFRSKVFGGSPSFFLKA